MISSQGLKDKQFAVVPNGYSIEEVDNIIAEAASTIDAYAAESEDMYHKMEVLAGKIEEYRAEEDSIKTALITAQKMADKITKESSESASALITTSESTAKSTIDAANAQAEKIVSEARDYAAKLISEKTAEANKIVEDAQAKANDAINSSKIISKDVLDQAKAISEDLIEKSKEEQEAYSLLTATIKSDAAKFIDELKALYSNQLSILESANLESGNSQAEEQKVDSVQEDVDSLIDEIDEMEQAIPEEIVVDQVDAPAEDDTVADTVDEPVEEAPAEEPATQEAVEEFVFEETELEPASQDEDIEIIDDEPADPMAAVEAFSTDEITPIADSVYIPEISEDAQMEDDSLFDKAEQPFESYFNIKREDDPTDRSETISLVPPEGDADDDDDEEPKFKGFFKKKK